MAYALCGGGRSLAVALGDYSPLSPFAASSFGVETLAARTIRIAGTISHWGGGFDNIGTGRTFQLRKSGGNALSRVFPADTTSQILYDTTDSDHYGTGDTICMQFNGSSGNYTVNFFNYIFFADSGHATMNGARINQPSTSTNFFPVQGGNQSTTEATVQAKMRTAGTYKNMCAFCSISSATPVTLVFRKNGVTGAGSVTITSGTTGVFEDTTHSDTFASGDLICTQATGQDGSGNFGTGAVIAYNAVSNEIFSCGVGGFNASNTFYPIVGDLLNSTLIESLFQLQHGFQCGATNFRANIQNNTMTGTTTFNVRKNGANGNQTFTVGATLTGYFEDTTNVDSFAATDTVYYMQTGGTSGSISPLFMMTEISAMPLAGIGGIG